MSRAFAKYYYASHNSIKTNCIHHLRPYRIINVSDLVFRTLWQISIENNWTLFSKYQYCILLIIFQLWIFAFHTWTKFTLNVLNMYGYIYLYPRHFDIDNPLLWKRSPSKNVKRELSLQHSMGPEESKFLQLTTSQEGCKSRIVWRSVAQNPEMYNLHPAN